MTTRILSKHKYRECFRQYESSSHHLYQIYLGGFKEKIPFKYCKECDAFIATIARTSKKTLPLSLRTKGYAL